MANQHKETIYKLVNELNKLDPIDTIIVVNWFSGSFIAGQGNNKTYYLNKMTFLLKERLNGRSYILLTAPELVRLKIDLIEYLNNDAFFGIIPFDKGFQVIGIRDSIKFKGFGKSIYRKPMVNLLTSNFYIWFISRFRPEFRRELNKLKNVEPLPKDGKTK